MRQAGYNPYLMTAQPARLQFETNTPARPVGVARGRQAARKIAMGRMALYLSAISCIQFFVQADNLGFADYDYTQAIIKVTCLALGFAAAAYGLSLHGFRGRLGKDDLLIGGFVAISIAFSWRSWNFNLSVVHALCYLVVIFNTRVALEIAGVRETFATLYRVLCLIMVAGIVAAIVWPQQYQLLSFLGYDLARQRLSLFHIFPIEVADLMVLNLIVGMFLKMRHRLMWQLACLVALLCTASRASVACGLAVLILAGFQSTQSSGKWRNLLRACTVLGALALVGWFIIDPTSLVNTLFPTADTGVLMAKTVDDGSLNGRFPLWMKVIDNMSIDNLMGYGFYGYRKWVFDLSGWAAHAHNSILDGILTGGYVGAILLTSYVTMGLVRARKGVQPVPPAMCRCLILYIVVAGMIGPEWLDPHIMMYIAAAVYAVRAPIAARAQYPNVALQFAHPGRG
jgi:O-Antigen ligase